MLAAQKKAPWHESTLAFASTSRSLMTSLCPQNWRSGTGHISRIVGIGLQSRFPRAWHRNSYEAASKLSLKLCSLLSTFLSSLGGSVLEKASPDATFARKIGILRLWRKKRRKEALQAFNAKLGCISVAGALLGQLVFWRMLWCCYRTKTPKETYQKNVLGPRAGSIMGIISNMCCGEKRRETLRKNTISSRP